MSSRGGAEGWGRNAWDPGNSKPQQQSLPPGSEHDLSGHLQQLANLQAQQGIKTQKEQEYRTTITNYANGLLAIYSQPEMQAIVSHSSGYPEIGRVILGYPTTERDSSGKERRLKKSYPSALFTVHPTATDPHYSFPVTITVHESSPQKFNFFLECMVSSPTNQQSTFFVRDINTVGNVVRERLTNLQFLQLDSTTQWEKSTTQKKSNHVGEILDIVGFRKMLTIEDFLHHPQWLNLLNDRLKYGLDYTSQQTTTYTAELQDKIDLYKSTPIAQVINDLRDHSREYSPVDLYVVAQTAAETVLESTPALPQAVNEEQVRAIVAQMITERLAGLQLGVAPISTKETLAERFVNRSRDKKKMTDALLALSHLIPGSNQVLAILEAINIMFGPEEKTR